MVAINITKNKPLKDLSTFGIGGLAEYFTSVRSIEELRLAIRLAKERRLPLYLLGNGSNTLFPDEGLKGFVVRNQIRSLVWKENRVIVGSGYLLPLLARKTAKRFLSGLEFAWSIPGTVGGAIWMNAGANGCSMSDCLSEVGFIDLNGTYHVYPKSALSFGYRSSSFQKKQGYIVWAAFSLRPDPNAYENMLLIGKTRRQSQPLKEKSIGSIFKNPEGISAGKLIDQLGWKNFRIGGAKISSLHANFMINVENATQKDVLALIDKVKNKAQSCYNVSLDEEIVIL
ncbi:MAG: UDP-N-acetylmuramate dehydrogenase [Chlamydiota bacterium]